MHPGHMHTFKETHPKCPVPAARLDDHFNLSGSVNDTLGLYDFCITLYYPSIWNNCYFIIYNI